MFDDHSVVPPWARCGCHHCDGRRIGASVAGKVLAEAGYTVVEAARADDALAIMKSRSVDLLFTDVQMPGSMDGLELARHVRSHWPRVAVLIASGNSKPALTELPAGSRFLRKPHMHQPAAG